jgi:hypothetical protein
MEERDVPTEFEPDLYYKIMTFKTIDHPTNPRVRYIAGREFTVKGHIAAAIKDFLHVAKVA